MGEACWFHLLLLLVVVLIKCRAKYCTERIELRFALKLALVCFENKLRSQIRPVVGLQYSKIDLGYHDFHTNCIITLFKSQKRVSEGFLGR